MHVVAPKIFDTNVHKELKEIGVHVHEITMDRTGMNPLNDLKTIIQLYILMIKNDYKYFLSYTHSLFFMAIFQHTLQVFLNVLH